MAAMLWVMSGMFGLFYQTPLALVLVVGTIYFIGFYIIQSTGTGLGMLFIVTCALITIMGLGSYQAMEMMRAEMTKAALFVALLTPLGYLLLPTRTRERHVDEPVPADENGRVIRALIRAVIMLVFKLFLYTFVTFSNIMLGVASMFVLVFSTRDPASGFFQRAGLTLIGALAVRMLDSLLVPAARRPRAARSARHDGAEQDHGNRALLVPQPLAARDQRQRRAAWPAPLLGGA